MKPSIPALLLIFLFIGVFFWIIASKISGIDDENNGNGTDKFSFKNLIAMIIFYGGGGLVIFAIYHYYK
jgi:vacuolar-type H+-ATPase subunit I/STV1